MERYFLRRDTRGAYHLFGGGVTNKTQWRSHSHLDTIHWESEVRLVIYHLVVIHDTILYRVTAVRPYEIGSVEVVVTNLRR